MGVGAFCLLQADDDFPGCEHHHLDSRLRHFLGHDRCSCLRHCPACRIKGFYLAVATLAAQFFLEWCFVRIPWLYNYSASGAIQVPQRNLVRRQSITGANATPTTRYLVLLGVVVC